MPAYAYPIKINRKYKIVNFEETKTIQDNILTLKDLRFTGDDPFSVTRDEYDYHEITVYRNRHETKTEHDARVAQEEAYMAEYNKRKSLDK